MVIVVVAVLGLGIGFALGRIKNVAKLAAVSAELKKIEDYAISDVKSVVARIRAKL